MEETLYMTSEMVYRALVQLYRSAGQKPIGRLNIVMYFSANGYYDTWMGTLKFRVKAHLRRLVQDGRAIQTWPDECYAPISTLQKAWPSDMRPTGSDFLAPMMPPGFSPMHPDFNSRPQQPWNEPFGRMMPPEPDRIMAPLHGSKPDYGSLLAKPKPTLTKDKPRPWTDDIAEEDDGDTESKQTGSSSNTSTMSPTNASDSSGTMLTTAAIRTGASSMTDIDEMLRLFRPLNLATDQYQTFVSDEKPTGLLVDDPVWLRT